MLFNSAHKLHFSGSLLLLALITCPVAMAQMSQAKFNEAVRLYAEAGQAFNAGNNTRASELCDKGLLLVAGQNPQLLQGFYSTRAQIFSRQGKYDLAEKAAQLAVQFATQVDGKGPSYGLALMVKAKVLVECARFAAAEPLATESASIMEHTVNRKKDASYGRDYADALTGQMMSLAGQGKEKETVAVLRQLLPLRGKPDPGDFELYMALASASAQTGDLYYKVGKLSQAETLYKRSIALYNEWNTKSKNNNIGTTHVLPYDSIVLGMKHLCEIYIKSGRTKEAADLKTDLDFWTSMKRGM